MEPTVFEHGIFSKKFKEKNCPTHYENEYNCVKGLGVENERGEEVEKV